MTDRTPVAFVISLTFHALVVAILLLFAYAMNERVKEVPKIFELVAGRGNNFEATVAPALGEPGGAKLTVPVPAAPKPVPTPEPEPVAPEPVPAKPAPVPEKTAPPVPPAPAKKLPDLSSQMKKRVVIAESKAKQQLAKEHADEAKRLAKEAADRAKAPKYTPIDSEGIREGVVGGSTANKTGGAGGKALTAEEGAALDRYFSMLKRHLLEALDRPAGLSDTLVATVEFHISGGGMLTGVRIKQTSGSAEFDRAVLEAFARVGSVGPRPDGKSEVLSLDFKMKELDGG